MTHNKKKDNNKRKNDVRNERKKKRLGEENGKLEEIEEKEKK